MIATAKDFKGRVGRENQYGLIFLMKMRKSTGKGSILTKNSRESLKFTPHGMI
jgi:hypothetical protein